MAGNISLNPILTTNAPGSFYISSDGLVQGVAMDDPATRFALYGAALDPSEVLPMWGGVAISENIPQVLGGVLNRRVKRATSVANMTGLSVFDQNYSAINTPQSQVPLVGLNGTFNFYRFGSGARIAVACDPVLASLEGGLITQQVSWDFAASQLVPFNAAYNQVAVTAVAYSAANGGQVTLTTASAHGIAVGADFDLANFVTTGPTLNGTWTAATGTTGSTLVFFNFGATTPLPILTEGVVIGGGGALPAKILGIDVGNYMTVSFNVQSGFANWNRSGSCALIQI